VTEITDCASALHLRNKSGSLAIFAAIRRAYAGCTAQRGPACKKSREHGTTPGEVGYEASTRSRTVKAQIIPIPSIRSGSKYTNLSSALR
jgi:hypothetical protein